MALVGVHSTAHSLGSYSSCLGLVTRGGNIPGPPEGGGVLWVPGSRLAPCIVGSERRWGWARVRHGSDEAVGLPMAVQYITRPRTLTLTLISGMKFPTAPLKNRRSTFHDPLGGLGGWGGGVTPRGYTPRLHAPAPPSPCRHVLSATTPKHQTPEPGEGRALVQTPGRGPLPLPPPTPHPTALQWSYP